MSDALSVPVSDSEGSDAECAVAEAATAASDAFGALGNGTRMGVIRSLFEAERDAGTPVTLPFSTLFEASDEETTAGFAYHLRQLPGTYVEKVGTESSGESGERGGGAASEDDPGGYRLTAAGRRAARAVASGALTESVDRASLSLDAPCPFCGEAVLRATGDDTVLTVDCGACEREVLALPFPPAGYRGHDDGALPAAIDRYYRGRIATMRDGTCPECGGPVETAAELVDRESDTASEHPSHAEDESDRFVTRARMTCDACGYRLRCPVTLTLLEEPAVVAAFHGAGVDLADRPLWNVGPEWRERVVSTDPLAIRVTARVDDTELACFVARDLSVVYTDHASADDDPDGEGGRSPRPVAQTGAYSEPAEGETEEETGTEAGAETDAATA